MADQEAAEAADTAADAPADDAAQSGADEAQQTDPVETKARLMGWDPAKGPLSAEDFVKRGEEIGGFVKKHNEKLERDLKKANDQIAELKTTMDEAKVFFSKTEERAYKQARKDLQAELDVAVDAGDREAVRDITQRAADLEADARVTKADPNAQLATARDAWVAENPWFESDPVLRKYAIGVGEDIKGSVEPMRQFAEIARQVKEAFPEKFGNPRRSAPSAVEGASNGRRSAAKGWADLSLEAKAIADRFIKAGFVKDRDAYVKNYDFGA